MHTSVDEEEATVASQWESEDDGAPMNWKKVVAQHGPVSLQEKFSKTYIDALIERAKEFRLYRTYLHHTCTPDNDRLLLNNVWLYACSALARYLRVLLRFNMAAFRVVFL
jgi:hypothetical protein